MCQTQMLDQVNAYKDPLFKEEEKEKDVALFNQPNFEVVEENKSSVKPPVDLLGVQQKQQAQGYLNENNAEMEIRLSANVQRVPGEVDVEAQRANKIDAGRSDKSRKKHQKEHVKLSKSADAAQGKYEQLKDNLKASEAGSLSNMKTFENNCVKSGTAGIELSAQASLEGMKALCSKDSTEVHMLARVEMYKNEGLRDFYKRMLQIKKSWEPADADEKRQEKKLEWKQEKIKQYTEQMHEYDKLVEKQRSLVESSRILSTLAEKKDNVKGEIGAKKQGGNLPAGAEPISVDTLSYQDFARMIGTRSRGQVAFSENGLKAINNGTFSKQSEEESEENLRIHKRFLEVIMEKMGENGTEEFYALTRLQLGLNDENLTKTKPLSRKLIQTIISNANANAAIVEKTLKAEKPVSEVDGKIAKNIGEILGGRTEKAQKKEINSVVDFLKGYAVKTDSLSKHQMDNLLKGNLPLLRDEIFASVNTVCKQIVSLGSGKNAEQGTSLFNVDRFLDNKEAMKLIAGFHIKKMAAGTEAGAKVEDFKLQELIQELTFEYTVVKEEFKKDLANMRVPGLEEKGGEGLELKAGKQLSPEDSLALEPFKELCNNLRSMNELRMNAFENNLDEKKVQDLSNMAAAVDFELSSHEKIDAYDKLISNYENTRFSLGYKHAKELVLEKNFSFSKTAMDISSKYFSTKSTGDKAEDNKKEDASLNALSKKQKDLALVLTKRNRASEFISKKDSANFKQDILRMRDFLGEFSGREVLAKPINIGGKELVFVQDSKGILKILDGKVGIPLGYSAENILQHLESEILLNDSSFPQETTEEITNKLSATDENSAEMIRVRGVCLSVLKAKTGKPGTYFNNVSSGDIMKYMKMYSITDRSKEGIKNAKAAMPEITKEILNKVEVVEQSIFLTGKETLSVIEQLDKEKLSQKDPQYKAKVQMEKEAPIEDKDQPKWTGDEKKIVDLVSELIFSTEVWVADELKEKPGERAKKVLVDNISALRLLIQQPELVASILDRMPLGDEKDVAVIKDKVKAQLDTLTGDERFDEIRNAEEKQRASEKEVGQGEGSIMNTIKLSAIKIKRVAMDKYIDMELKKAINNLSEPDEQGEGIFAQIEKGIDDLINGQSEQIQEMVSSSFKDLQDENVEEQKEPVVDDKLKKDKNAVEPKTSQKLNEIMEKSIKGETGQGLFLKNMFQSYFSGVETIDKRAMFAAALRYSVPKQKLAADASDEKKEQEDERAKGSFVKGFLKGAGPLMQKTLQGMPLGTMPPVIDGALKDIKSKLAPIPRKYVEAQLNAMVNRSNGKIKQITMKKSLGAASVGETFLCTIYGTTNPEGKEVVVKLLRPDVRNRMEREKKVMLAAAESVGPGMKKTYLGQLQRIEEEMDLSIEGQNAQAGAVYDNAKGTVKSMKINPLVEPTMNSLVLEKASGTTLDRYMTDTSATREKTMSNFYVYKKDENGMSEVPEKDASTKKNKVEKGENNIDKVRESKAALIKELKQLQVRQEHLIQMADSWVREGIYGKGFYHGDLHSGNIMLDDKGLTLIDFGNATQLKDDQRKNILRMMAAASGGAGFTNMFKDSFHELLEGSSEDEYKEKEGELGEKFNNILQHGNSGDAGLRIGVSLMEAQNSGVEVPGAIWNFSNSQMRLQNAIGEMNSLIKNLQEDIKALHEIDIQHSEAVTDKEKKLELGGAKRFFEGHEFKMNEKANLSRSEFSKLLKSEDPTPLNEALKLVSHRGLGGEAANSIVRTLEGANATIAGREEVKREEEAEYKERMVNKAERKKRADKVKKAGKELDPEELEEAEREDKLDAVAEIDKARRDAETPNTLINMLTESGNLNNLAIVDFSHEDWGSLNWSNIFGLKRETDKVRYDEIQVKLGARVKSAIEKNPKDMAKIKAEISLEMNKFMEESIANDDKMQDDVAKYRAKGGKADPELESEIYNQYQQASAKIQLSKSHFEQVRNRYSNEKLAPKLENDLENWYAEEKRLAGEEKGDTIRTAYSELQIALKDKAPDLAEKEIIFFKALQKTMDKIIKTNNNEKEKSFKGFNEQQPTDFVDVVASVISSNMMASFKHFSVVESAQLAHLRG